MDTSEFVALVRRYVSLLDHAEASDPLAVLRECATLLPRIYAAGLELPDVEPTEKEVRSIERIPKVSFGRFDFYWELFDPYVLEEPVASSLADDLGDIYRDLAEPLAAFDKGRVADAIWEWKFTMKHHAGKHIVDSLRAIHAVICEGVEPGEKPRGDAVG